MVLIRKVKPKLHDKYNRQEMENLRNQIQPDGAPILTAEQPPILPDLNDAIATVRKQYEAFNTKSLEDLDNYYKEKVRICCDNVGWALPEHLPSMKHLFCSLKVRHALYAALLHAFMYDLEVTPYQIVRVYNATRWCVLTSMTTTDKIDSISSLRYHS